MKANIFKVSGEVVPVVPGDGKKLTLEEMRKAIGGGYVERLAIPGGEMYFDEDGIAKELPLNARASNLAGVTLRGDALVLIRKVRS